MQTPADDELRLHIRKSILDTTKASSVATTFCDSKQEDKAAAMVQLFDTHQTIRIRFTVSIIIIRALKIWIMAPTLRNRVRFLLIISIL